MQNALNMHNALRIAVLVMVAVLAMPAHAAGAEESRNRKTYMWIDKNGQRQYGDAIPPEYAQSEQRVLNRTGIETSRQGAPKTAEQLAVEEAQRAEQKKREDHDRFLITTYTSVRDIDRLRDERLSQLDAQLKAARSYIETLDQRMRALQQRAQNFKPYSSMPNARRLPDDVAEQLVRGLSEITAQRSALDRQQQEKSTVSAQFDADRTRYVELDESRKKRLAERS